MTRFFFDNKKQAPLTQFYDNQELLELKDHVRTQLGYAKEKYSPKVTDYL